MSTLMSWARRAAGAVSVLLFTTLFLVFIVQVVARFGFNKPLPWTDEAAVALYVWVILWSAAFVVPEREHVMFDLLWNAAGRRGRLAMRIAGNVMVGGLAAWALPATWDYVKFMQREGTPVLNVPFSIVFLPFVALLISLALRCGWNVIEALRGHGLEDAGIPAS